jgi:peptide/nickel transport system ATP-binding protein
LRDAGPGRQVSCHLAEELALEGIQVEAQARGDAVARRFARYSAAQGQITQVKTPEPIATEE